MTKKKIKHEFNSSDAKSKLGMLIDIAIREPVLITRNRRPIVVVLAYQDYEALTNQKIS